MIPEQFVFLAVALNFIGGIDYFINTARGKTKPNRVTWLLWALIPLFAFATQRSESDSLSSWFTLMVGINPLMIFIASFLNKKAYWKLHWFDYFAGVLSILSVGLWLLADNPTLSLAFFISADLLAGVPTLIKSYTSPHTESVVLFVLAIFGGLITLLTIDDFIFLNTGYAWYIFLITVLFSAVILVRRQFVPKPIES